MSIIFKFSGSNEIKKQLENGVDKLRVGIKPENRIIAKGYGESQLIIANAKSEDEHQINRRTEFKVTSYEFIDSSGSEDEEEKFFNNN